MSQPNPSDENRRVASEALTHLDALAADPHFAWFVEHVLVKARDAERDAALNAGKSSEERDRACWRHDLARQLCDEPRKQRAMYQKAVAAAAGG